MIERTRTIEECHQEPINAGSPANHFSERVVPTKRRGRPRGTNYRGVDASLHEDMRRLLESHAVPSLTAAAASIVARAFGSGSPQSKITRLVRTYPFDR